MVSVIESEGYTVSVTNIVKCNPLNDLGNNRNPTPLEISKCSIHLEREIRIVKPRMIIILGKVTEKFLNISRTQVSNKGEVKSAIGGNIPTLTIFHPSAVANYHKKSESEYQILFSEIINVYRAIYNEGLDQRKLPIFSDGDCTNSNHEAGNLDEMKKMIEEVYWPFEG
jgi:uracil-DNA glycosylase family 4